MSDPYLPPNQQSPYVPGRDTPNAVNPNASPPRNVHNTTIRTGSGPGTSTGIIVALALVVIAALAYVFYNPTATPVPADGATTGQSDGEVVVDPVGPAAGDTTVAPPADATGTVAPPAADAAPATGEAPAAPAAPAAPVTE